MVRHLGKAVASRQTGIDTALECLFEHQAQG